MNRLENAFLEEYKRVEAFCNDAYSCKNGVTEYINCMEKSNASGEKTVASWKDCYDSLKHLRRVRNKLVHEPDAGGICTEKDLKDITAFHEALLKEQDALTLLRKACAARTKSAGKTQSAPKNVPVREESGEEKNGVPAAAFLLIALVVVMLYVLIRFAS